MARLQAGFAEAARSPGHYEVLDEREIGSGPKDWQIGKDKRDLQRATHLSEELASQWKKPLGVPRDASEVPPEEGASVDPLEEPGSGDESSKEEVMPSAKKLKTVDREASYVMVASPGESSGYTGKAAMTVGWVGRETSAMLRSLIPSPQQAATPTRASYVGRLRRTTEIANRAKPRRPIRETARSPGLKPRGRDGVRALGPRQRGQASRRYPR